MRGRPFRLLLYLVLLLASIFYLAPVYVMVVTSLKSFAELGLDRMWYPPENLSFASFARAWFGSVSEGMPGLSRSFMNSVYLAVPGTLISAMLGSLNGHVLANWKFRGADILFPLLLFALFIPYQSILIPLVQTLEKMQLFGTIPGLILVHVIYGIPITTLIFRNYYASLSDELIQAARIEGASPLGVYRWVLFPISMPAFIVVVIWQFTSIWNEFLFAIVLTTSSAAPITAALNDLAGSFIVEWNVQVAGALLAALPTLLVYLLLGRFFVRGLMAGALRR